MSYRRFAFAFAFVSAGVALLSACGLPGVGGQSGNTVQVTLTEYHVTLDRTSIPAGKVTFQIANTGSEKHELVILRTSLAAQSVPIDSSTNKATEEGDGVEHVDEIDGVPAGEQKSLTVDLKAGRYLLVCNYPGHFHDGMVVNLTVD